MILRVTFSIYLLLVLSCKCGFRSAVAQPVEAPSAEASPAASPTKKPSSRPSARARARIRAAERRAARAAKKEAEKQRMHEQWLARLIARGTTPWPEPTEQQHAAALARYRAMIAEVQKLSPESGSMKRSSFCSRRISLRGRSSPTFVLSIKCTIGCAGRMASPKGSRCGLAPKRLSSPF